MKKQSLLKQMRKIAKHHDATLSQTRQGKHEIWECEGLTIPVPRHAEISEGTARSILDRLTTHLENR